MGNQDVETAISTDKTISVDADRGAASTTGEAVIAQIDRGSITTRVGLGEDSEIEAETGEDLVEGLEDSEDGDPSETTSDEPEASPEDGPAETTEEDLGDYDPTDEKKIEQFDARYVREDGTLDLRGKLSEEFWANAAKGVDGVNESTYAYLRDRFGISKEDAKDFEAAMKNQSAAAASAVYDKFGGKENLDAAMEWARKGGYTKAQRDRFNAIVKTNDAEAVDEALTALDARWRKANSTPDEAPRPAVKPKRDVTSSSSKGATSGVVPYATHEDWAKDFGAADKSNATVMAQIRRRLKASPWYSPSRARK